MTYRMSDPEQDNLRTTRQLFASDMAVTLTNLSECVHIGCQASLPGVNGKGFGRPQGPNTEDRWISEAAGNTLYDALSVSQQDEYLAASTMLFNFLTHVIRECRPIDEITMLDGRREVFWGWLHGRDAAPRAVGYDGPDIEQAMFDEVTDLRRSYEDTVEPALQRTDENIVCLGILALDRPENFPVFKYYLTKHAVDATTDLPGIQEAELRGLAAVKRVVRVSGHATPLQAALLERVI